MEYTSREAMLDIAKKCVCGDRDHSYGNPENNFGMIAKLWSDYLGVEVSAVDVSMMMVLFKAARVKTGTAKIDSFIDIAGYAACGCEIAMSEENEDGRSNQQESGD